jgi:hypothetical protein
MPCLFNTPPATQILSKYGKEFTWELKAKMMGKKALDAARVLVKETGLEGRLEPGGRCARGGQGEQGDWGEGGGCVRSRSGGGRGRQTAAAATRAPRTAPPWPSSPVAGGAADPPKPPRRGFPQGARGDPRPPVSRRASHARRRAPRAPPARSRRAHRGARVRRPSWPPSFLPPFDLPNDLNPHSLGMRLPTFVSNPPPLFPAPNQTRPPPPRRWQPAPTRATLI